MKSCRELNQLLHQQSRTIEFYFCLNQSHTHTMNVFLCPYTNSNHWPEPNIDCLVTVNKTSIVIKKFSKSKTGELPLKPLIQSPLNNALTKLDLTRRNTSKINNKARATRNQTLFIVSFSKIWNKKPILKLFECLLSNTWSNTNVSMSLHCLVSFHRSIRYAFYDSNQFKLEIEVDKTTSDMTTN